MNSQRQMQASVRLTQNEILGVQAPIKIVSNLPQIARFTPRSRERGDKFLEGAEHIRKDQYSSQINKIDQNFPRYGMTLKGSSSLKYLKQKDDLAGTQIDPIQVKLKVEHGLASQRTEQHRRKFPLIQIKSKISRNLKPKFEIDPNLPRFLIQQKQMSRQFSLLRQKPKKFQPFKHEERLKTLPSPQDLKHEEVPSPLFDLDASNLPLSDKS